jgi:hypothetical protein
MRILEARFHPIDRDSPSFVVVARLIWEDGDEATARIAPAPSLERCAAPSTMLATLRHLVRMTAPRPYEGLQALRSRFWSFVIPTAAPAQPSAA